MSELTVAASQTEADLARTIALNRVDWATRELFANLLRVSRGAGKSHEIAGQAAEMLNAFKEHWDVVGYWPWHELGAFISPSQIEQDSITSLRESDRQSAQAYAETLTATQSIVSGAFQIAASSLLQQPAQLARGKTELSDGIRELEAARKRYMEAALPPPPPPGARRAK